MIICYGVLEVVQAALIVVLTGQNDFAVDSDIISAGDNVYLMDYNSENDLTSLPSAEDFGVTDMNGSPSRYPKDDLQPEVCPLTRFSVRAENKGWREFQITLHAEELFDFILADPQQTLSAHELKQNMWTDFKDEKRIREFANFSRVSLRPGCSTFFFMLAEELCAWRSAFLAEGMKVMTALFLVIPRSDSVRVTKLKDLPQPNGDLAVVAKTPGKHPGFMINLSGSYTVIDCTHKRKIGIIDQVPRCSNPLRASRSKAEVRPRERHPDVISEIIETFCVQQGTVLDVFGGALTTAFSCISSGRPCVVLEKDSYCFDLAIRRLQKLCRDRLLNPFKYEDNQEQPDHEDEETI